jgi:hypothetical protein
VHLFVKVGQRLVSGVDEGHLLVGYTSAISVANSAEGSNRLATTGRLLPLTDTKSTTTDDEHRSRGLYPE